MTALTPGCDVDGLHADANTFESHEFLSQLALKEPEARERQPGDFRRCTRQGTNVMNVMTTSPVRQPPPVT